MVVAGLLGRESGRRSYDEAWAHEVAKRQSALTAGKQEASKELADLLGAAARVATAIQKLLAEHYGLRSEKLAEFNMQPFRGRRRQSKPEPPSPPAPEPTGS